MIKTLLQGRPYVPSVETDLRKTFARERKRLRELEEQRSRDELEAKQKVSPMKAKER